MKPNRPLVRYHGGKWRLAPWIIRRFPLHRIYVEPFGGGASVLLQKPRAPIEIYNDLDSEMVNLFKVARDNGDALCEKIALTPFAEEEFLSSYQVVGDDLERARLTLVRSFMGFHSSATNGRSTSFLTYSHAERTTRAQTWRHFPMALTKTIERLQGIEIRNEDAFTLIQRHDRQDTLFYIDPPYLPSTRRDRIIYRYELSETQHIELAQVLKRLTGKVILSGYRSPLYDELYADWQRFDKPGYTMSHSKRLESLWLSPNVPLPSIEPLFTQ